VEVYRRIVERVRDEGSPSLVITIALGCMGISATLRGAHEVAIQLLVQAEEQPISPLDHLSFTTYMAMATEAIPATQIDELKARGRQLTFAEGAALAFSVLA
jgi:hypothetical protein